MKMMKNPKAYGGKFKMMKNLMNGQLQFLNLTQQTLGCKEEFICLTPVWHMKMLKNPKANGGKFAVMKKLMNGQF